MSTMTDAAEVTIGVLALQGAFIEHVNCMKRLGCKVKEVSKRFHFAFFYHENIAGFLQIREVSEIEEVDGIILPGGVCPAVSDVFGYLLSVLARKAPQWL
jgi:glutamine amidotransferase PdxT